MLKPSEKTFTKEVKNLGKFVFQYPTLQDELAADEITAKLLGENKNPSIGSNNTAVMIGTLKVGIVDSPAEFDLDEIYSYDELKAVYDVYIEQVLSFRNESPLAEQPRPENSGFGSG